MAGLDRMHTIHETEDGTWKLRTCRSGGNLAERDYLVIRKVGPQWTLTV